SNETGSAPRTRVWSARSRTRRRNASPIRYSEGRGRPGARRFSRTAALGVLIAFSLSGGGGGAVNRGAAQAVDEVERAEGAAVAGRVGLPVRRHQEAPRARDAGGIGDRDLPPRLDPPRARVDAVDAQWRGLRDARGKLLARVHDVDGAAVRAPVHGHGGPVE